MYVARIIVRYDKYTLRKNIVLSDLSKRELAEVIDELVELYRDGWIDGDELIDAAALIALVSYRSAKKKRRVPLVYSVRDLTIIIDRYIVKADYTLLKLLEEEKSGVAQKEDPSSYKIVSAEVSL